MPRYIFSKRNGHRDGDSVRLATFTISTNINQPQTLTTLTHTHKQDRNYTHTSPFFLFDKYVFHFAQVDYPRLQRGVFGYCCAAQQQRACNILVTVARFLRFCRFRLLKQLLFCFLSVFVSSFF